MYYLSVSVLPESWGWVAGFFAQGLTGLNQGQTVGCDLF